MPIADVPDEWTWEPDPDVENENGQDTVDDQTREVWAHGLSAVTLCRDYRAHGHVYRWGPDTTRGGTHTWASSPTMPNATANARNGATPSSRTRHGGPRRRSAASSSPPC